MGANAFMKVDKSTFRQFVAANDEGRYEFERGRIVQQMTVGTKRHGRIAGRFYALLGQQIDTSRWVAMFERGVETPTTIRYADVLIEQAEAAGDSLVTTNPAMIVEVLSPSSMARDLDAKPTEYLGLPTLQAYVVASQDEAACLIWLRDAAGHFPDRPTELRGSTTVLRVPALGVAFSLSQIYDGIC
jgi:Uma2 family endonuclease